MIPTEKDELASLLPNRQLNDREVAWLWHFVRGQGRRPPVECTLNSSQMREQIARRLQFPDDLKHKAERGLATQLVADDVFQWIKKDERQTGWLAMQATKKGVVGMLQPAFTTTTGKKSLITTIDAWDAKISTKEAFLRNLERQWNEHLQSDRIFKWFKTENEQEKCSLAWDWIERNKPALIRGEKPFTSHRELLTFFDRSSSSSDEKAHYVEKIKRRWSTQKHRENTPHKKQYNFVLTDSVNAALDQLATDHQVSRTKILERLVLSEAAQNLYLSPKD